MFVDALLLLSDAQAVTVDAVSTNTVDSSAIERHLGVGEPIGAWVIVDVAADYTTTDETYGFELIMSAAEALTSPIILSSKVLEGDELPAGSRVFLPWPEAGHLTQLRYFGINYNTTGTTPTITVTAGFGLQSMFDSVNVHYASGFTVS
jgi:hypothetical protein